jgi:hypothetical protein
LGTKAAFGKIARLLRLEKWILQIPGGGAGERLPGMLRLEMILGFEILLADSIREILSR